MYHGKTNDVSVRRLRFYLLLPTRIWLGVLLILPLAIVAAYSLLTRGDYGGVEQPWTLANYARIFDPLYGEILLRSVLMAVAATAVCLLLGFPFALFISGAGSRKNLYLQLVTLPFWTSFLVRIYAWLFLLRDTGLINTALIKIGVISQPLPLLYNNGAVLLGLVYGYLPYMVLPIYAAIEKLDPALLEAAADLGAPPAKAIWRVTVPLAIPGMLAGALLVFIPTLGAYLIPDLLGGGKTVIAGNLIQNQFTTARDWPFGSAVSLALMAVSMILLLPILRRSEDVL